MGCGAGAKEPVAIVPNGQAGGGLEKKDQAHLDVAPSAQLSTARPEETMPPDIREGTTPGMVPAPLLDESGNSLDLSPYLSYLTSRPQDRDPCRSGPKKELSKSSLRELKIERDALAEVNLSAEQLAAQVQAARRDSKASIRDLIPPAIAEVLSSDDDEAAGSRPIPASSEYLERHLATKVVTTAFKEVLDKVEAELKYIADLTKRPTLSSNVQY